MDEKFQEINDLMKRDKVETTSKISVIKSDFEERTFDHETFNFLKNQVR